MSSETVLNPQLTHARLMANPAWDGDPTHLAFALARHKFVAKMLSGRKHALGVGCADAYCTRLVLQEVEKITATDFDQAAVDEINRRRDPNHHFECRQHDLLHGPVPGDFDAAYAMDVIEHIPASQEDIIVGNIARSLGTDGILILGSPSLESQPYGSPESKLGDINRKSGRALKALMERFFHNVFLFSMNDETVHTGYVPMAQYLIAVGSMKRSSVMPMPSALEQAAHIDENPIDMTMVVPCLNEEHHILPTLDTVVAAMNELPYSYEILVVDDGCTDGTAKVVENYMDAHPGLPIQIIRHPQNRGLTRSYVDGAFRGRGKYYRQVCGDNAESKEALIACFKQLGKADIVIPYHQEIEGKSAFRRGLSNFYTTLVNLLSGHKIHYYNGLAVHLRYNVMRWGPYSFGFGFQAELITRLLDEGVSFVEVPITATHRDKSTGNSALNFKNLLSVGHTLTEMFIRRVRKRALRK